MLVIFIIPKVRPEDGKCLGRISVIQILLKIENVIKKNTIINKIRKVIKI